MREGLHPVATEEEFRQAREYAQWMKEQQVRAERLYAYALGRGHKREAEVFKYAAEQIIEHRNPKPFEFLSRMNKLPVTLDEFITSPEFLGEVMEIWPKLLDDLRSINPDVFVGEAPIFEALLGGATGTGKTHLGQATLMYHSYLFDCFTEVQPLFRLTKVTPIVFLLQSVSTTITKRVIYDPLRAMFLSMPYVKKNMTWDPYKESILELSNGVVFAPAQATIQAMVGQAIPAALVDEINFMTVVENSKQVPGPTGLGGKYDQAEVVYTNLSRRRKRSFMTKGYSLGTLMVSSSTRYVGDFLDRRIDEVHRFAETNIIALRRKQYEVQPEEKYSGKRFPVLIGNSDYPTRVVEEHEVAGIHYPKGGQIEMVPVEHKVDFLRNPEGAQRDLIGIATAAITPFIRKRQKINDAMTRGRKRNLPRLVEKDYVELSVDGMPTFLKENFPTSYAERRKPRWIHVDLSRKVDRCGIAMVRLDGFINKPMSGTDSLTEALPHFSVELAVGIQPSVITEIDIAEVRGWILGMIQDHKLNVRGVSFDGFDSQESMQAFRKAGVWSERISMDLTTKAYDATRDLLYEDRLDIQPDCVLLQDELRTLEYYADRDVIDHPPNGTKDVSDGVAGAVTQALKSRIVRSGVAVFEVEMDDAGWPVGEDREPLPEGARSGRFKVRREHIRVDQRERPRR